MRIANPSKAFILVLGLISLVVLMLTDKITSDQGLPIISGCVMYAIGNGVQARKGEDVSPIIGKKTEQ